MRTLSPRYPLLRKDLQVQGPRFCVQLGDKLADYNEDFRLFLSTRSTRPALTADAAALVTVVNFTTTRAGLANQLLVAAINKEKPDIEKRKTELVNREEELKLQLAEVEETLLQELANSQGNILENKALLDSLTETQAKSGTISDALTESMELQSALDKDRHAYLPLALAASQMYFVVEDLGKINPMCDAISSLHCSVFEHR